MRTLIARTAKRLNTGQRGEQGNAVVEFALLVPILTLLLVGVVDVGRVIDANARLNNGVTAGLRYAMADAYAQGAIETAAIMGSGFDNGEVTARYSMFCQCPDGSALVCSSQCGQGYKRIYVQVDMTHTVTSLFHYPGLGDSMPVSRSGVLQIP